MVCASASSFLDEKVCAIQEPSIIIIIIIILWELSGKRAYTRLVTHGTPVHSRVSSLSHCELIFVQRVELVRAS